MCSSIRLSLLSLLLAPALALAQAPKPDVSELEEKAITSVAAQLAPSVVTIETVGGLERVGKVLVGTGPTTGLVVGSDGYIVSSAFNFIQQPNSILVTLPSGKRAAAKIVARDLNRMLVLLKVDSDESFQVPPAVPRAEIKVGQTAIALGRTFEGALPNMSVGIVSATNRIWGKAIQTDAKISPSNYGGPIADLRGRVLGILVPLSPQGNDEVAGAEWYDSGIGFAVPLDDVMKQLDRWKKGQDLHPGLLGVALKPGDIYSLPATIVTSQPNSPAAKAGIKEGDTIIELDGQPIERQAQLKHVLGAKYAGDKVKIVVRRGEKEMEKRIEAEVELAEKLLPYQHPFLGILPRRVREEKKGVVVRYVFPGSPAANAGIMPGDRIVSLAGKEVPDGGTMQELITAHEKGAKVTFGIERGADKKDVEVTLGVLPTDVPTALPPAHDPPKEGGDKPAVGVVPIKLPEEKNEAFAYVPENYSPDVPYGVVVWLHAPGGADQDKLVAQWKDLCAKHDLILLAPRSLDKAKWEPTEVGFIRKTLDEILNKYNVDRSRIVVHGQQGGAAMAYLVAFAHRDLIRGVAAVDSPPPARTKAPANDPVHRLAFYIAAPEKGEQADRIKTEAKDLEQKLFPVTRRSLGDAGRPLNAEEQGEVARWVDILDRI